MAILQPIKPQYCELIASGKKTIEVRKTKPKLQTPFKVYIYMTTEKRLLIFIKKGDYCGIGPDGEPAYADRNEPVRRYNPLERKVIGEYVCDEIIEWTEDMKPPVPLDKIQLSYSEIRQYGGDKTLYLWHISDLKIYDKPKELSEFYTICNKDDLQQCGDCKYLETYGASFPCEDGGDEECLVDHKKPLTRPPQSWCYVEEVS